MNNYPFMINPYLQVPMTMMGGGVMPTPQPPTTPQHNSHMHMNHQTPTNSSSSASSSSSTPTVHQTEGPGLMQHQKEKYGAHLFQKNDDGSYTCFFAGCGKQLSANFSRHISRHEQDGDPLDSSVEIRGTYVPPPPKTPTHHGQGSTSSSSSSNTNNNTNNNINSTPSHSSSNSLHLTPHHLATHHITPSHTPQPPISMLTPLQSMVMPPALPLPFSLPMVNPAILATSPLAQTPAMLAQQQPAPIPPPTIPTPIKTRQSSTQPPRVFPSQQEMELKGIPYQVCQHPSHNDWWGTSPVLPHTEFYNRASKCKKCYIRQQQDAKKRKQDQGSTNISHVMTAATHHHHGSSVHDDDAVQQPPQKIIRQSTIQQQLPQLTPIKPPVQSLPILQPPVLTPQQQQMLKQQQLLQQQIAHQSMVASGSLMSAPVPQAINKLPFSRPKREPTFAELNSIVIGKCREIVSTLLKDPRSKPFREPVDPIKLNIPDYNDIIKHPRDLGTIESTLAAGKYPNYSLVHTDIKLVFKNAMTFNEEESEIYELAEELDTMFDDLYKKAFIEAQAEAQLQAEIIKDMCSICGHKPVPYKRPPQPPSSDLDGQPSSTSHLPSDEMAPVPLLLCEGSCLRAFHLHCLGLPVDTKPPWMCEDCHQGRPVLHFDSQRQEYFYYYYEGVLGGGADEESDASGGSVYEGNDEIVSDLGTLSKEEKKDLRQEEENHRVRDMYFDPVWCMWRCKSRVVMKQREERQRPVLSQAQTKSKRVLKQQQQQQQSKKAGRKSVKKRY